MKKNEVEGGPLDVVPQGCFASGNPCAQVGLERVVVSEADDDSHLSDFNAVRGSTTHYRSLDQIRQGLVVR